MAVSRRREDVQARHQEIQRLRQKPRFTLKAIAEEVGLADHTTVWWHLNGNCTCLTLTNVEWTKESQNEHVHVWKCECGASG